MIDLGLNKPAAETRVVVAMSGGVDSSVAAGLMTERGYDVIGITLQLYDYGQVAQKKGACCAGQDIYDAAMVAEKIGIPHYVFDYEDRFKQGVIDDFVESYLQGETPIPCVRCNQTVKFKDLLQAARDLNADAMVTGHYVQRLQGDDGPELHAGVDPNRDQSYFLFATTKEQLDFLHFPLGHMSKDETRAHAARFGLEVADKPDSQDICFVPNGDYAGVIKKMRPDALEPGDVVDMQGNVLGQHPGIINFTIGQRRRLYINSLVPKYVVKIIPETRQVVVGDKEDLQRTKLYLKEINWLADVPMHLYNKPIGVKIRSSNAPMNAGVKFSNPEDQYIELEDSEYGISPGQACVMYDGTRVLGGGWIVETA
ncbi:MAG: tRNA 2-thiouridine(34) synthase MnmA [Candidatus Paracaedibacteraceae bacterium]|nr:tRNA 2-thiouridine(34) synthase MnmA [Candidatus Paracaedibacteraceae bacterium]